MEKIKTVRWVRYWLLTGIFMIFFQIIIGGVTRLTGSGLSITKWDIVMGTIPPLNQEEWDHSFDLYKAGPQYQKINQGMSIAQFKWIFFWEYIHRFWARIMGFVFLIPLLIFWMKGHLKNKELQKDLLIVFLSAAMVAAFGWIMVASGLVNRPWVNAYKLSIHLGLALFTLTYLFWTYLKTIPVYKTRTTPDYFSAKLLTILVGIQIFMGGLMSGMKAALMYPTFPKMNKNWIDPILFDPAQWRWAHMIDYDINAFAPALVQVLHRGTAGIILCYFLYVFTKYRTEYLVKWIATILGLQIVLGIITILNSKGIIPVFWALWHQGVAIILLLLTINWMYKVKISDREP